MTQICADTMPVICGPLCHLWFTLVNFLRVSLFVAADELCRLASKITAFCDPLRNLRSYDDLDVHSATARRLRKNFVAGPITDRLYFKLYCLGAEKPGNKDVHQSTRTDVCFSGYVTARAW